MHFLNNYNFTGKSRKSLIFRLSFYDVLFIYICLHLRSSQGEGEGGREGRDGRESEGRKGREGEEGLGFREKMGRRERRV